MMDDGSRLVAEIAAAAVPAGWICCAGLGLLCCSGREDAGAGARLPEAEVLATDVSAKRLAQMQARMRRYEYAERVKCGVVDAAGGRRMFVGSLI